MRRCGWPKSAVSRNGPLELGLDTAGEPTSRNMGDPEEAIRWRT
jgi:hypothetical protein